jgi:hypothetical protein
MSKNHIDRHSEGGTTEESRTYAGVRGEDRRMYTVWSGILRSFLPQNDES